MKYYFRYPDRALAGMAELDPAQRGIYNSVIDLLYARDGIVPCMTAKDDYRIAKGIAVAPQTWRRFKRELMELGKIRISNDGLLDANGVAEGRKVAQNHSDTQRKRITIRWQNYKTAKEIKAGAIPRPVLPIDIDKDNSETSTRKEMSRTAAVDEGDNFGVVEPATTAESFGQPRDENEYQSRSPELREIMRAKGWIR